MAMVASDAYAMYYPHQVTLFFGCVYVVCECFLMFYTYKHSGSYIVFCLCAWRMRLIDIKLIAEVICESCRTFPS